MTTMKDGPGDDPFADDTPESESVDGPETEETPDEGLGTEDSDVPEQESTDDPEEADEPDDPTESTDTTMSTNQIPYVVRRQTVKEDRTNELVTFARDEYDGLEDDVHAEVADKMDMSQKDVALTDVREAFIELASNHPDEVADILLDWGYEHRQ